MSLRAVSVSHLPSLYRWSAQAIGPRVSRLLLGQLLLATLVAGVNWRSAQGLAAVLRTEPDVRLLVLVLLALLTASSGNALRRALCPTSLASLRRQPLGPVSLAAIALPWALPLAWPWVLVVAIGQGGLPGIITGAVLGTLSVVGAACAITLRRRLLWALVPLVAAVLVERVHASLVPVLVVAATFGVVAAGRAFHAALVPPYRAPGIDRGRAKAPRTPLGGLLALDRIALGTGLHWLQGGVLPLIVTLYVVVLDANGNCTGHCLDLAALIVVTLGAVFAVAVLDALRRVHGRRLLAPDRVVPTRLRLASLFLIALFPLLPFVLVLLFLSGEVGALPHAIAVALVVLYRQLCDLTRAAELGPLLWTLAIPTAVVLLPNAGVRSAASVAVALAFLVLVDRRGRRLRAERAAGRSPSTRY